MQAASPTGSAGDCCASPDATEFGNFADVVMRFVHAAESLLKGEMSHPFSIGSEALRDCAANQEHSGTQSEQTLLTLALQQVAADLEQCDLLRGVAAVVRVDQVVLAPFPLARTCTVIASKAWYVLTAESRGQRLRRYLNEELAALCGTPLQSGDEEAAAFVKDRSADYLAVGATAGLTPGPRKIRRRWDTPFLVRRDQARSEAPPSETQLVKSSCRAVLQARRQKFTAKYARSQCISTSYAHQ